MSDKTITYTYDSVSGPQTENMYEMLNQLRFSLDEWQEVKAYADERDVILFSTVNSPSGVEYAEMLGLEAYKLSSWDFNYLSLWRRIARLGKPMIIDTGPVNTLEVAKVMQLMKAAKNDQSILVHCVHTNNPNEINMRSIPYMKKAFQSLVGYSSNFSTTETDIMAVTLGAVLVENRLTISRELQGHHHVISKEPDAFITWVKQMRDVRSSLGDFDLKPSKGDLAEREKWFRHLVAKKEIPAGTILEEEMLEAKRPEQGITPEFMNLFVGRTTKRDISYNETISWEDI